MKIWWKLAFSEPYKIQSKSKNLSNWYHLRISRILHYTIIYQNKLIKYFIPVLQGWNKVRKD